MTSDANLIIKINQAVMQIYDVFKLQYPLQRNTYWKPICGFANGQIISELGCWTHFLGRVSVLSVNNIMNILFIRLLWGYLLNLLRASKYGPLTVQQIDSHVFRMI